ncbi:Pre-mRNA-splicing factor cwc26 [Coemansia sp. RSA 2167]|nr:Pre-mRNA-splicing factor cwc26 [Coemansia sp. RSA 2167]
MSLNDYLAKHYGSTTDTKRKSKKSERKKHVARGTNVVITEDDDSVFSLPPREETVRVPKQAQKRFKETSAWHSVQPASLEDAVDAEDEQPVIAEGADLVREYEAEQQQKKALERKARAERKAQEQAMKAEQALQAEKAQPDVEQIEPNAHVERYGLLTAHAVKEDADHQHKHRMRRMHAASSETSGRGAATVHRNKKGQVIDAEQQSRDEADKVERSKHLQALHTEWNKGAVQQKQRADEERRIERVRATGKVDYGNELDEERRAKQHWNDPALKFLEDKPKKTARVPEYKGQAPPNRFGIRPGYRWDGVDRSNGFEKDMLVSRASASARRAEDYTYSVADL